MSNEKNFTAKYDELPLIVRILIQIFAGVLASCVYRVLRFIETKNTVTLVIAIVAFFTGIGTFILSIIDLITLIFKGKYTIFVD